MKNKVLILGVAGLVVVGAIVGIVVFSGDNSSNTDVATKNTASQQTSAVSACDLFTEVEAKQIIGDQATKAEDGAPTNTNDVYVTTCTYSNNAVGISNSKVATILVRSALTSKGVDSNQSAFADAKIEGAETVEGYGEEAYFVPSIGQLNILKDKNWIIVSYGGTAPSTQTLANAIQVADATVK